MTTIILRNGSKGDEVVKLQRTLNEIGYPVGRADGWFGAATEKGVRAFQYDKDLIVDGIAGERTLQALYGNLRPAYQLKESDLVRAARDLGVELASVHALAEVESAGNGFLEAGVPVILFERHWMRRQLLKLDVDVDVLAYLHPDLVNSDAGGYLGGRAEHDKLARAKLIHEDSAIESASWGRFQVMGFHWKALGYPNAKDFERRMRKDEGEHLEAFTRFILNDAALLTALRRKDWAEVARLYNGPAYAKNHYDVKLGEAYLRHASALTAVA